MAKNQRKRIVIDRQTWGRGGGDGTGMLLSPDDFQCCLGFVCEQEGVERLHLRGVGMPAELGSAEPARLRDAPAGSMSMLAMINDHDPDAYVNSAIMELFDDYSDTEARREQLITERLGKLGYDVEFVN